MQNKIKLLIVDDLEDNRLVLIGICRKIEGLEILEAANGKEAIDMCEKHSPQIVLMDMMMPIMGGAEATGIIKSKYPNMIVIIVTAVLDDVTEEQMIKNGATAYIHKPIKHELFSYKIKNYINLIKAKEGIHRALPSKKAFNPFSKEVRSFKTIFQIENPDDMMDLGMWLLNWCGMRSDKLTYMFDVFVGFIYLNLSVGIKKSETASVVIEEDFEDLFISIVADSRVELVLPDDASFSEIRDNIIVRDNTIYICLSVPMLLGFIDSKAHENTHKTAVKIEENTKKKAEVRAISEEEKALIRKSFEHKTSAKDYVADIGGDVLEEIQELESIDKEWIHAVEVIKMNPSAEGLQNFANTMLKQYAQVLNGLFEFASLGLALASLRTFIVSEAENIIARGKCDRLTDMLSHLGLDLAAWRRHIFIEQDTKDIHYLDSSFFASCIQLEGVISDKNLEEEENDLELF